MTNSIISNLTVAGAITVASATFGLGLGLFNLDPAQAITLTPSDVLVVDFNLSNPLTGTPNTLVFGLPGTVQVNQPFTSMTAKLFNGNTLLGTSMGPNVFGGFTGTLGSLASTNAWKNAASPYTFGNPATNVRVQELKSSAPMAGNGQQISLVLLLH